MNSTEIQERLINKLEHLSSEQLNSVWQFVQSLESEKVLTDNEVIDAILKTYQQNNKKRPLGLCEGEFIVPDNFNEPLPDEIIESFYS